MIDKYQDPDRTIAVSFNIQLPDNVYRYVKELQSIAQKYAQELRSYDSSPHLAIATKFMPLALSEKYKEVIEGAFSHTHQFNIGFNALKIADTGNYLFFEPDLQSRELVTGLRTRTLELTKGIGFETPDNLPPAFAYQPHISIIKSAPDSIKKVRHILERELKEVVGPVQKLLVTRESRDKNGYATFPQILSLTLN